jgi:hypothetical protein
VVPHPTLTCFSSFSYCSSSHTHYHCFSFQHASLLRIWSLFFHIPVLLLFIPRSYSLSYTCCSASLILLPLIPSLLALHPIFSLPSSLTLLFQISVLFFLTSLLSYSRYCCFYTGMFILKDVYQKGSEGFLISNLFKSLWHFPLFLVHVKHSSKYFL